MKISVIIPTYKPQEYIWECLDSLYCQTLDKSKFEIILVLNGCDEPWRGKIETWIASHTGLNINFVQTDTPGVSNARNIGLSQAKGEYITFIDDDDYVSSEYLQRLLDASAKDAVVLADSRAFIDGKTSYIEFSCHKAYVRCAKCEDQNILHVRAIFDGPCMKLIPKNFIHGIFFDTKITNGEDSLFMFEISRNVKKLQYASEDAIYYRRYRINSAFTQSRPKSYWVRNTMLICGKYLKIWLSHPFSYNICWVVNRFLAAFKTLICRLMNKQHKLFDR